MATDTETWAALIELAELLQDDDNASSSTYVTNYQGLVDVLKGNRMQRVLGPLNSHRALKSSMYDPAILRQLFRPFLEEFADIYDWPVNATEASDAELMRRLREQMVADGDTLNSNDHTLDTTFADVGTVVGTGTMYRLTVDEDGNEIEGVLPGGTQTFRCVADARGGEAGRAQETAEIFRYEGLAADPDFLSFTGTGLTQLLQSANASDSNAFIRNASFEEGLSGQADDTTCTASIFPSGWTLSTAASFAVRTDSNHTLTFRGYPGLLDPDSNYALEFNANANVTQILQDERPGLQFNKFVPYHVGYAGLRQDAGDGTLTGAFGGINDGGTAVSSLTSWTHVQVTSGQNCWPSQWNQNDLALTLTLASRTTGSVIVDDVIIKPYTWVPGLGWICIVGGAVPWVYSDTQSLADAIGGTRARLSWWLARAYGDLIPEMGGWLPVVSGGVETIDTGN